MMKWEGCRADLKKEGGRFRFHGSEEKSKDKIIKFFSTPSCERKLLI